MFLLFDFIVLMDLTLIEHEDYFIPMQTKFGRYTVGVGGGGGGVILNHPVPLSICLSEDEKFPDLKFETPV